MKKSALFVALAIVGVLLTLGINDVLAAEETKPLKCKVPMMATGAFQILPKGNGDILYGEVFYSAFTATVIETIDVPSVDEKNKPITIKMHRFSANYDKPTLVNMCPMHGPEPLPYELYSKELPASSLDRFLVAPELCQ